MIIGINKLLIDQLIKMDHIYASVDKISLNDYKEAYIHNYEINDYISVISDEKTTLEGSELDESVRNILVMKRKNIIKKCKLIIIGRIYNFEDDKIIKIFKQNKLDEINLRLMEFVGTFAIILIESCSDMNTIACFLDYAGSIKLFVNKENKIISTDEKNGKEIPRGCKFINKIHETRTYKNISKYYSPRECISGHPLGSCFVGHSLGSNDTVDKSLVEILKDTIYSNLILYSQYDAFVINDIEKLCNKHCAKILKTFFGGKIITETDNVDKKIMNISFYPLDILLFKTKDKAKKMCDNTKIKEKYYKMINGESSFKIEKNTVYPLLNWNIVEILQFMKIEDRNLETVFEE